MANNTYTHTNPFDTMGGLLRELKQRLLRELDGDPTPELDRVLEGLNTAIADSGELAMALAELEQRDPEGFRAFQRAQGRM